MGNPLRHRNMLPIPSGNPLSTAISGVLWSREGAAGEAIQDHFGIFAMLSILLNAALVVRHNASMLEARFEYASLLAALGVICHADGSSALPAGERSDLPPIAPNSGDCPVCMGMCPAVTVLPDLVHASAGDRRPLGARSGCRRDHPGTHSGRWPTATRPPRDPLIKLLAPEDACSAWSMIRELDAIVRP